MDWKSAYKREQKVSLDEIAQYIKDNVPMHEVLSVYCPELQPRHNRVPCPLHNGKDYNFSFGDSWYKCYVCGASGDAVNFVKELLRLPTRFSAMQRLNQDLMLHLPIGRTDATFSAAAQQRRREVEERKAAKQAWEDQYHEYLDEWIECDKVKRSAEPLSDEWCDATKRMEYLDYLLKSMPDEPR